MPRWSNLTGRSTGFDMGVTSYTATVLDAVKQVTVLGTAEDSANDTVSYSPADADGGTGGHQVDLPIGDTEITITVTSAATTKTYKVTVTRIAANDASLASLSLSAGELSPKFAAGTTAYTASVPNDTNATS